MLVTRRIVLGGVESAPEGLLLAPGSLVEAQDGQIRVEAAGKVTCYACLNADTLVRQVEGLVTYEPLKTPLPAFDPAPAFTPATRVLCTVCGVVRPHKGKTICATCAWKQSEAKKEYQRRWQSQLKKPSQPREQQPQIKESQMETPKPLPANQDALALLLGPDAYRSYLMAQALELLASAVRCDDKTAVAQVIGILNKIQ